MTYDNLLYMQIKRYLELIIEQNRNDSQFLLPSEKQLALRFQCSRIPAKRALNELEAEGRIYRIQGKGSLIVPQNAAAQSFKKSVALLIPNITSRFTMDIYHAIQDTLYQEGFNLFLSVTRDISDIEDQIIDSAVSKQFDGLIIFPVIKEELNKNLLNLVLKKYPIVFVGRTIPGVHTSYISCDHAAQTLEAMDYLYRQGHRRIGFITENAESAYCYTERIRAYRQFMEERCGHRPRLCEIDFFTGRETREAQRQIQENIQDYLEKNRAFTAYLTTNLAIAPLSRVLQARAGLRRLQFMVFDQPEPYLSPDLGNWMVVDQEPEKQGRLAAQQLIDQIRRHSPPQQITTESRIVPVRPFPLPL